ncbi:hypothetical protein [Streptomyces sp. SPB074]|uniref:hypothetical protein n=1 Tax=Streptomyces sp. (strain SPB074) TaxID=465543 RepID=UPI0001D1E09C|nr:hypothetical protein [Streptomyces sp. SPB074]EFG64913.1 conserved hypothetical protein [Streptomyces sp. SPB074]
MFKNPRSADGGAEDTVGAGSAAGGAAENDEADREAVEEERAELREFVKGLRADDIKSGHWFTKLLSHALNSYARTADWQYFQERYEGVPPDAVVDARIKLAARYAALEGGLSAGAYTATVAATLGSLGGASPATVPAAVTTAMVDIAYTTRLQLRLAHDIAVLYRVPVDLDDPEDMWKLVRVAFTIKGGESVREGLLKAAPALTRRLIKRYYSKSALAVGRSLPVVGRHLLQRNVIKIGIPVVGVPLAVVLNRWTTLITGRHAREVFRNEARVRELAGRLSERTLHPGALPWVAWLVMAAKPGPPSDDKKLLMRHLTRAVRERHQVTDEELARLVEIEPAEVWRRLEALTGDLSGLVTAAEAVAAVDGPASPEEAAVLTELRVRCGRR